MPSYVEDAGTDARLSRRTQKRPGPTSLKIRPRLRAGNSYLGAALPQRLRIMQISLIAVYAREHGKALHFTEGLFFVAGQEHAFKVASLIETLLKWARIRVIAGSERRVTTALRSGSDSANERFTPVLVKQNCL